jgi:HD-like signal output (HDOD) protein/CheY-like chemotaxis protein
VIRKRILFVDDEPLVLDSLRLAIRPQVEAWEAVYAIGGAAAVDELARQRFDVVVCDASMPGIDGSAVLKKVKSDHPSAVRIVLSGQTEREAVMRILPIAQQFVSKPCDAEMLRSVIDRACQMQALLASESVRQVVGRLDKLPSLPVAYWALTRALADSDADIDKVARIVEKDPAMSVKVMQLVNSAYFGLPQRMNSIHSAVAFLGFEMLKGLALTASVFAAAESKAAVEGFSIERLQRSSLLTARVAKLLVSEPRRSEDAFTAGLLHDIGKLILAMSLPAEFAEVIRQAARGDRPLYEIERERLGVTHAEAGAYLLGVWGLPFPIVEAVAFHHAPCNAGEIGFDLLAAVHIADALVEEMFYVPEGQARESVLDTRFVTAIGAADAIDEWRVIARELARASGGLD